MDAKNFPEKVRRSAEIAGLPLNEVARRAEVNTSRIYEWLKSGPPRWDNLLSLARVLGVSVEYLVDDAIPIEHRERSADPKEERILEVFRMVGYEESMRRMLARAAGRASLRPAVGGKPGR
jgi:transcriptional regulator with XRE-family HTH domain